MRGIFGLDGGQDDPNNTHLYGDTGHGDGQLTTKDISETVDKAAQGTVDLLHILGAAAVGAAICMAVVLAVHLFFKMVARRRKFFLLAIKRLVKPAYFTMGVVGAYAGLVFYEFTPGVQLASWYPAAKHFVAIMAILGLGWFGLSAVLILEDVTQVSEAKRHDRKARRIQTQAQVLRRVLQVIVVVMTLVAIALTFPPARAAMASLLASAGLVSLIAGLAAQSTLANMFAGLQVAFSDAIRQGDVVICKGVDGATLQGTIEEITLTYVVLRVWDGRRLVVPTTSFTQSGFENWTRKHTELMGTVEFQLDWSAPVGQLRKETERLLQNTELWDKRVCTIQVSDATDHSMTVRLVVSAANSGELWDLRCYMREHVYEWIVQNAPYALPRVRREDASVLEKSSQVGGAIGSIADADRKRAAEATAVGGVTETAGTAAEKTAADAGAGGKGAATASTVELVATKTLHKVGRKLARVRRRSLRERLFEQELHPTPIPAPDEVGTTVTDRLYSGSPEAEERGRELFAGPAKNEPAEAGAGNEAETDADVAADTRVETAEKATAVETKTVAESGESGRDMEVTNAKNAEMRAETREDKETVRRPRTK
ncbi:MAG: mechanosensitive ion channel [Actinomycetaceae bacterium]|nr:mechanosensitive ion channel [Actinomycetaceae bacterium]